ncbi:MAG: hypothetical protein ACRD2G_15590, partial [Terriglobia bacterium]
MTGFGASEKRGRIILWIFVLCLLGAGFDQGFSQSSPKIPESQNGQNGKTSPTGQIGQAGQASKVAPPIAQDVQGAEIKVKQPAIFTAPLQMTVNRVLVNVTVTDPYDRIVT